ncbi:MAG: hypothetical protein ACP5PK_07875, partial [candidate division WOR-3 bacterium]
MKLYKSMLLLFIPILFTTATATPLFGFLQTGINTTLIDSITWNFMLQPFPVTESTPGWGGNPGTSDTFRFTDKNELPIRGSIYARINGLPRIFLIDQPLQDTWFDLEGSSVRFDTTNLQGITTPALPVVINRLGISPNPASGTQIRLNGITGIKPELAVELYTIAGRTVYSGTVSGAHPAVELTGIKPG